MTSSPISEISVVDFFAILANYFDRDPSALTLSSGLVDDLGFDSVDITELVLLLESLRGEDLADEFPDLQTVGDAFSLLLSEQG